VRVVVDLWIKLGIGELIVTNNESKLSQNYSALNQTTARLVIEYKKQLAQAISTRDVTRCKVVLSVLAVLDPLEYKNYLNKRKKNAEK
jgi:hypothetical protein